MECQKKSIDDLRERAVDFGRERGWSHLQTPKKLCFALVGELGELLELFEGDYKNEMKNICEELSDVILYGLQLSNSFGMDISAWLRSNIIRSEENGFITFEELLENVEVDISLNSILLRMVRKVSIIASIMAWKNEDDQIVEKEKIFNELGTLIKYCIMLGKSLEISLTDEMIKKMKKNCIKYPIYKKL